MMKDKGRDFDMDDEYIEYRHAKRVEEAEAAVQKLEYDCLSAYCDRASVKDACKQAETLGIGALVVFPAYVKSCVMFLGADPQVSLIAAIAYPTGGDTTEIKAEAVKRAVRDGADEVEVCAPTPFIKDGNWGYVKREFKKLKKAARIRALRIVFNCALLTEKELIKACSLAAETGVNCVRLCGADGELIARVKSALKGRCLIKADRAETESEFNTLCVMGADYVSCSRAFEVANALLRSAEDNI